MNLAPASLHVLGLPDSILQELIQWGMRHTLTDRSFMTQVHGGDNSYHALAAQTADRRGQLHLAPSDACRVQPGIFEEFLKLLALPGFGTLLGVDYEVSPVVLLNADERADNAPGSGGCFLPMATRVDLL